MSDQLYTPIGDGQIRLLGLRPESSEIKYDLETVSLFELPEQGYTAVSYAWGRAEEEFYTSNELYSENGLPGDDDHGSLINKGNGNSSISILNPSGSPTLVEVTQNLAEYLAYAATLSSDRRYYWADALCICQTDLEEKASQVTQMDRVYNRATTVVVWLGQPRDPPEKVRKLHNMLSAMARRFLEMANLGTEVIRSTLAGVADLRARKTAQLLGLPDDTTEKDYVQMAVFFQRRWFGRVWTVQEMTLAEDLEYYLGGHVIDHATIANALSLIVLSPLQNLLIVELSDRFKIHPLKVSFATVRSLARTLVWNISNPSVHDHLALMGLLVGGSRDTLARALFLLLISSRLLQATDTRDRVFSLLGLLSKVAESLSESGPRIRVDYLKTDVQVLTEAIKYVLEATQDLSLLVEVQYRSQSTLEGLPSWVPDPTSATSRAFATILSAQRRAQGHTQNEYLAKHPFPEPRLQFIGNTLLTHVLSLDRITHIGDSFGAILSLLDFATRDHSDAGPRILRFQNTLLCYLPDLQKQLTIRHGTLARAFHDYWKWRAVAAVAVAIHQPSRTRAACFADELASLAELSRRDSSGSIPSVDAVIALCDSLGLCETGHVEVVRDVVAEIRAGLVEVELALGRVLPYRVVFLLEKGGFVIGPGGVRTGDSCSMLPGCEKHPMIWRDVTLEEGNDSNEGDGDGADNIPTADHDGVKTTLLGEAYVPDLLNLFEGFEGIEEPWQKVSII